MAPSSILFFRGSTLIVTNITEVRIHTRRQVYPQNYLASRSKILLKQPNPERGNRWEETLSNIRLLGFTRMSSIRGCTVCQI